MILYIDQGNTRCKWYFCDATGRVLTRGGEVNGRAIAALSELLAGLSKAPSECWVANVAGDSRAARFGELCKSARLPEPRYFQVVQGLNGLHVAYSDLQCLGVDRWLAMLAGQSLAGGGFSVLSLGSAVTFDRVNEAGLHLGGLIAPGFPLLNMALRSGTASVPSAQVKVNVKTSLGVDTQSCVDFGVGQMLHAFCEHVMRSHHKEGSPLFCCGGDAQVVMSRLGSGDLIVKNDLVLLGMVAARNALVK